MALLDARNAGQIPRTPQGVTPLQKIFMRRFPDEAKRWSYMKKAILDPQRNPPANPTKTAIEDFAALGDELKQMTLDLGAAAVGIADFDPGLTFTDADELDHKSVIVFVMPMSYDVMIEIGPRSQEDVHKTYFLLDELATRLAVRISSYGYDARVQANRGEIPLPAYAQLAGLGELGKHGSLISPDHGSAIRISAVSTDMPLTADGPRDFGIDEICANCDICSRFCPGEAIPSQKVNVDGAVRWQIDTPACHPHFLRLYGCKVCLSVCPMNARGVLKSQFKAVARDIREAKDAPGMLSLLAERGDLKLDEFDHEAEALTPEDRELEWWGRKMPLRTPNYGGLGD
jgi:Pyruvate/2-oxoacid:ferredoxin oxidoreductase delta subunit